MTRRSLSPLPGDMPLRQRCARLDLQTRRLELHLSLASQAHAPQLRESHRQPQPLHTACSLHFAVMPTPQPTLKIFEPALDPRSYPVPTHQCFFRFQVSQDDPR
ncbi:MAG: hypothetical protein ACXVB7_13200 [Ktedonobacteraceae bacterium]